MLGKLNARNKRRMADNGSHRSNIRRQLEMYNDDARVTMTVRIRLAYARAIRVIERRQSDRELITRSMFARAMRRGLPRPTAPT
jgi:hypothetical protein